MTPHINAKKNDIANIVIMPGDPKRAKLIAENYLDNPILVNDVRLALCYTGTYKGKKISVMSSGMGMPSMAIYSYELFNFYEVEKIIRLGSCQSLNKDIKLNDIILATSSYTLSNFSYSESGEKINTLSSSKSLNESIRKTALDLNQKIYEGKIVTTDVFYKSYHDQKEEECIGLEMETFALLYNASKLNKDATSILTVSDSIYEKEELSAEEREKSFTNAIKLALESIIK